MCAKWYEQKPPPVVRNNKATFLGDFSTNADITIQANWPSPFIENNGSTDKNVSAMEFDKLPKYNVLQIEI